MNFPRTQVQVMSGPRREIPYKVTLQKVTAAPSSPHPVDFEYI